jgi:uncharacterized protein (DUF952 family)
MAVRARGRERRGCAARKGNMKRDRKIAVDMQTSLRGIAERASREKKHRFGHLYTMLNVTGRIEIIDFPLLAS